MKLSKASLRARNYGSASNDWYCKFTLSEVSGIGFEEGVDRRDPSSVIEFDGEYYVYYTKSVGEARNDYPDSRMKRWPWDLADIVYATSKDGIHWQEQGIAVPRGPEGSYDERTVCTPDIAFMNGRYYLVYQCVDFDGDYCGGTTEKVAMAVADNPNGPWTKMDAPILAASEAGFWFKDYPEDQGTYNDGEYEGTVHDPMLFEFEDKYFLYYKCFLFKDRRRDHLRTINWAQGSRMGVAIANKPEGPYIPCEYNPITNSGHETLLWKYDGGIACMLNRDGPECDTIQYAKDGMNFDIMSKIETPPPAAGAFRCDNTDDHPLAGIAWGLYHPEEANGRKWDHIMRFESTIIK